MPEQLNNLADFANETINDMSTFLINNKPNFNNTIGSFNRDGLPINNKTGLKPVIPRPHTAYNIDKNLPVLFENSFNEYSEERKEKDI